MTKSYHNSILFMSALIIAMSTFYVIIAEEKSNNLPINQYPKQVYHNNKIYLKTKQQQPIDKKYNVFLSADISNMLYDAGAVSMTSPYSKHYTKYGGTFQSSSTGLERICEITFKDSIDIIGLCNTLNQNEAIEYAEPIPMNYLFEYKPNDPQINYQWHLKNIDIFNAWEVAKDKTGVLIGIVDSGTDLDHSDLAGNAWKNPAEQNNNIDDDNNGYVDDIQGWNFVGDITVQDLYADKYRPNNDTRPKIKSNMHGTHTAGLAAAVVNNNTFGTGSSINCKFIATKHSADIEGYEQSMIEPYKGIIYCAEMGAKVINCSFGGVAYSTANKEIIEEVIAQGVVIVAAAGNESYDCDIVPSYPAYYPGVISVGAIDSSNYSTGFSNYGYATSFFAPGAAILSTIPFDTVDIADGTSMAAPIATGVAAIVRSVFPEYTPKQVYHQIRSTLTPTDEKRDGIAGKVFGKINAFAAVTYNNPDFDDKVCPGVSIESFELPNFNYFSNYNSKDLKLNFVNYIGQAKNLQVKFTSLDKMIDFENDSKTTTLSIGQMNTMESKTANIKVKLNQYAAISKGKAAVKVEYTDGTFYDFEILYLPINISTPVTTSISTMNNVGGIGDNKFEVTDIHYYDTVNALVLSVLYYKGYEDKINYVMIHNIGEGNGIYNTHSFTTPVIPTAIWAFNNQKAIFVNKSSYLYSNPRNADFSAWTLKANLANIISNPCKFYFKDANNGILLGEPNNSQWGLIYTADGGNNWTSAMPNLIQPPLTDETCIITNRNKSYCASFGRDSMFCFVSNKGRFYRTENVGNSKLRWKISYMFNDTSIKVMSIAFTGNNLQQGMAIFNKPNDDMCYLAKTIDGGSTWSMETFMNTSPMPAHICSALDSNVYFVATENNAIYGTNDFGATWKNANAKQIASDANASIPICSFASQALYSNNDKKYNRIKIKTLGWTNQYNSDNEDEYLPSVSLVTTTITEPFFEVERSVSIQPPSTLSFGNVAVGTNTTNEIEITNTGDAIVYLSDYKIIPANDATLDGEFEIVNQPDNVNVKEQVPVNIKFSPKNTGEKMAYVWIINNTDKSPEIALRLVGTGTTVGIAEENHNIFPPINPTPTSGIGSSKIFLEKTQLYSIHLINVNGEELFVVKEGIAQGEILFEINTKDMAIGTYFVVLKLNGKQYWNKLIVNK